MTLAELAFACFCYQRMTDYDGSYLLFRQATQPFIDLGNQAHRASLLIWLNQWGCRQFAIEYHDRLHKNCCNGIMRSTLRCFLKPETFGNLLMRTINLSMLHITRWRIALHHFEIGTEIKSVFPSVQLVQRKFSLPSDPMRALRGMIPFEIRCNMMVRQIHTLHFCGELTSNSKKSDRLVKPTVLRWLNCPIDWIEMSRVFRS